LVQHIFQACSSVKKEILKEAVSPGVIGGSQDLFLKPGKGTKESSL